MKYIYTCFKCGFPMAMDESEVPEFCPSCNAPKSQYLVEPWCGSIEKRRIHVDPPEPDPNWDKYDISYHHPKQFPAGTRHGRVRRFVMEYDDAKVTKDFYDQVFDWDIIPAECDQEKENPLMFCATGPGFPNWEPKFPSFGYGFLKPRGAFGANYPRFVVEVDNIDALLPQVEGYGGKVLQGKFEMDGNLYALLEDSEGNPFYIWQTPDYVTFQEPESDNNYHWERKPQ